MPRCISIHLFNPHGLKLNRLKNRPTLIWIYTSSLNETTQEEYCVEKTPTLCLRPWLCLFCLHQDANPLCWEQKVWSSALSWVSMWVDKCLTLPLTAFNSAAAVTLQVLDERFFLGIAPHTHTHTSNETHNREIKAQQSNNYTKVQLSEPVGFSWGC